MTVNSLFSKLYILDQSTAARFPDGSGGKDQFCLHLFMNGHGKVSSAEVERIRISRGIMLVDIKGSE